MREINLTGKQKIVVLNGMRALKDGFAGVDRQRAGARLLRACKKELPEEGNIPKELLEKSFTVKLEEVDFSLLKEIVEKVQWGADALEIIDELNTIISEAKKIEP